MNKVNFFIVGAPKAGTTALAEYLNRIGPVFIPPIKEPHFFCADWPDFRRVKDINDYQALYQGAEKKIKGDASVWYLYSKAAAREIKEYNAEAKVIIMIRRQAEAAYSLHSQLVYSGREDVLDFEEAWRKQPHRKQGKLLPENHIVKEHLLYRDVYDYPDQIERYFNVFGRENCLVLVYEEFFSNVEERFGEVLDFLSVSGSYDGEFERINSNRRHRFERLAHFLMRPPPGLRQLKEWIKKWPVFQGKPVLRNLYRVLSVPEKRKHLSSLLTREIMMEYEVSNERLREILARDKALWL